MNNKDTDTLLSGERKNDHVQSDEEIPSDTDDDDDIGNGPEAKKVSTANDSDHFKLPSKRKATLVSLMFIMIVVNQVNPNFAGFLRFLIEIHMFFPWTYKRDFYCSIAYRRPRKLLILRQVLLRLDSCKSFLAV